MGIERRLSRAGLLKGAAAGVAGLAAAETVGTVGAPRVAASQLEYDNFVAANVPVAIVPNIAFRTGSETYDYGVKAVGKKIGVEGISTGNQAGVFGFNVPGGWLGDRGTGLEGQEPAAARSRYRGVRAGQQRDRRPGREPG